MNDDTRSYMADVWRHQCRIGSAIPRVAIVDFELDKEFLFKPTSSHQGDFFVATPKRADDGA